jgi:predicted metal-dependent HD superfamily phosphohydrolase
VSESAKAGLAGLQAAWRQLLRDVGADLTEGERVFAALVEAYRGPGRVYHTLDHVGSVLAAVNAQAHQACDLCALRLAAWFHDAVYDPRASDNEERSAAWAGQALGELGVAVKTSAACQFSPS